MAIPIAAKLAAIVLRDEKGRKTVGLIIAACLSPLILIVAIICCLGAATADHNNTAIQLCFNGGAIPITMPAKYRQQITMTQSNFGRLDAAIAAVEADMEDGDSLDDIRVKAIFFSLEFPAGKISGTDRRSGRGMEHPGLSSYYALFFGRERYSERSCEAFVGCFYYEETRTRTVYDEDGVPYEEEYIVNVPINDLSTVYANIASAFNVEITYEDQINASEIYYRIKFGVGYADSTDWANALPLSDAPFIGVDGFCSPLGESWRSMVTSEFGYRADPFTGETRGHAGIDLGAAKGTSIRAALDGTVYFVSYSTSGYGYHLGVDHGGGFVTLYAHCSEILVTEGAEVKAGDIIARVGSTGRSTGPHLHFEIRIDGTPQDPRSYIPTN